METLRSADIADWTRPLERLMASHAPLREAHLEVVRDGLGPFHLIATDAPAIGGPDGVPQPFLMASGWAASVASLEDGRRQIVSLYLPGDVVDPTEGQRDDLGVTALTPVRTLEAAGLIATLETLRTTAMRPLAEAWARVRAAARARLVRQIVRLGRLSAYERTADLFLELHDRLRRAGLADGDGMPLPLTQEVLADHLGLSVVHMNRILQQLRRDELILHRSGRIVFPAPGRLAQARRRIEAA